MKTSPLTSASSFVSRRKFLNFGTLALLGGVLATSSKIWAATPTHENSEEISSFMPQTDGVFKVAPLPYAYNALEPIIDTETMHLHHDKHYGTYTKNLNEAIAKAPELKSKSITELLSDISALPASIRKAIRNNGGGYYNHSLFWHWMTPNGGGTPNGPLADAINKKFGSFEVMQEQFNKEALTVFGSGWAWLIKTSNGDLEITSTPNQDNPIMKGIAEVPGQPILGLDVWEHSYYLKYKNERKKYIDAWWKLTNWKTASSLFSSPPSMGL